MAMDRPPLQGLRVLDLSTQIAGPYAARMLREAGADVLKIEEPGGDPLRDWNATTEPPVPGEDAALFGFLNGGKKGETLDLATAEGRSTLRALAADADLLIESFGPGGLAARGLETLREEFPSLVVLSLSWWGLEGPWAERPANEWTLQGSIGMTARRGYPEQGPVGCAGRFGEWSAGSAAAVAAVAACMRARASGEGEHIDLSIFEAMLLCMTQYHTLDGQFRPEPLPPYVECPSIERTRDGWVGIACVTPPQWEAFCGLMERPEWTEDPRLVAADERMKYRDTIHRDIIAWMAERTTAEVIEACALRRIPVSPVGDGTNFGTMEQMAARGLLEAGPSGMQQPRPPVRLHGVARMPIEAAPRRGASGGAFEPRNDPAEAGAAEPASQGARDGRPLGGLRVLDLTAFWAGPMCTSLLAAMGADVVKVEAGKRPDGMRFVNTMPLENFWEAGSIFHGANLGKRGITIALDTEEGRALFRKLAAEADVVVENYSVRVMENFGFTPEKLQQINPRLICVRMPSWGLDGPWRDRVGFAMTIEQCTGLAWISGYPDRPLTVNVCDSVGALHTAFGVLLALEDRRRTGRGRLVEVPLVEPGLTIGAELIMEASRGRTIPREGNRGPLGAPQGCWPTADGSHVALSVETDAQWEALVRCIAAAQGEGDTAGAPDRSWAEAGARRAASGEVEAWLAAWIAQQDAPAVERLLLSAGVPATVLHNAHAVMPNAQLEARGFFEDFEHPVAGAKRYPTLPWRSPWADSGWYGCPPPTLGQHNAEVLGALGLAEDELADLEARGILASRLG